MQAGAPCLDSHPVVSHRINGHGVTRGDTSEIGESGTELRERIGPSPLFLMSLPQNHLLCCPRASVMALTCEWRRHCHLTSKSPRSIAALCVIFRAELVSRGDRRGTLRETGGFLEF